MSSSQRDVEYELNSNLVSTSHGKTFSKVVVSKTASVTSYLFITGWTDLAIRNSIIVLFFEIVLIQSHFHL